MADSNTRRRVKLYMLNEQRMWDDKGTGHVSSAYVERLKGIALLVRSESDGLLLLESKIQPDTAYQKQQETLIVWSEADNYDLALSFQERLGCEEIWERICEVQGRDPNNDITQEFDYDSDEDQRMPVEDLGLVDLPPCQLSKLDDILALFSSALSSPVLKDNLGTAIEHEVYIPQLLRLFRMCEELENISDLHKLFGIFKTLFLLNKSSLFEVLFSDEYIFDVIGALEYDPNSPQRTKHREFLKNKAVFKGIIPLNNPELVQKIHQTYRVQYIQDVILPTPSVFEENMLSTLTSFIFFNKVEIVGMIQDDEKFLRTLFSQIVDDTLDDTRRKDLVMFLKELVSFSQALQPRDTFFKTLSNMGILGALEIIMSLDGEEMRNAAIDILTYIVEFSPSMVREYIVAQGQKQDDEDLFINLVIEMMISDTDPELGGALQISGILRVLIDPDNMMVVAATDTEPGQTAEDVVKRLKAPEQHINKSEFLGFFYKHSMHVLTAPLLANTVENKPSRDDFQTAQLLSIILEVITFCIEHHCYFIKNYIINKNLLRRVLVLLKSKHAFLALGALRLMRRLLKDEEYILYIMRGDFFRPVCEAFKSNGSRYNLLNSAMIEMFEFIRVEDNKPLIAHIVTNFYKFFEDVTYVQTFKELRERYEQQKYEQTEKEKPLDGAGTMSILQMNRFRRDVRRMEEEEELYFEQDDLIEEEESIMPLTDTFRPTVDTEFDQQLNKILENRKARESETKEFSLGSRLLNRGSINMQIPRSPPITSSPPSPTVTPLSSPANSPSNSPGLRAPFSSPTDDDRSKLAPKKLGLVGGLVDYPDEDSDPEEEEEEDMPNSKRPRLST